MYKKIIETLNANPYIIFSLLSPFNPTEGVLIKIKNCPVLSIVVLYHVPEFWYFGHPTLVGETYVFSPVSSSVSQAFLRKNLQQKI